MSEAEQTSHGKRPRSPSLDRASADAHNVSRLSERLGPSQSGDAKLAGDRVLVAPTSPSQYDRGQAWSTIAAPSPRDAAQSYSGSYQGSGNGSPNAPESHAPFHQPSLRSVNSHESKSSTSTMGAPGPTSHDGSTQGSSSGRPGPQARQRTAVACRYCRKRKIRCTGISQVANDPRCSNCRRLDQECIYAPVSAPTPAAYARPDSQSGESYQNSPSFSGNQPRHHLPQSPPRSWPVSIPAPQSGYGYSYPAKTTSEQPPQLHQMPYYRSPSRSEAAFSSGVYPPTQRHHTPPFPTPSTGYRPSTPRSSHEKGQASNGFGDYKTGSSLPKIAAPNSASSPSSVSISNILGAPLTCTPPAFDRRLSLPGIAQKQVQEQPLGIAFSSTQGLPSMSASFNAPSGAQVRSHHDNSMLALLNPQVGISASSGLSRTLGNVAATNDTSESRRGSLYGSGNVSLPSASTLLNGLPFTNSHINAPLNSSHSGLLSVMVPK